MTIQISPSEWETLSSYLDNQLSERERTRLEARLKSEPELRQALEDLRRTRVILRSQARLRAPRNFTLTPATAGVRARRFGLFAGWVASPVATLRLASALAAIFLVLITVGDLAVRRFAPAPATISMSEQPPRPIMGLGGGGGGGGDIMPLPAPTEAAVEAQQSVPADQTEEAPAAALMVTPLGSPEVEMQRAAKEPPAAMDSQAAEDANALPEAAAPEAQQPEAARQLAPTSAAIRILQALLILLALGAGIGALILRRNAG